ncbi:MAG TPA: cold shock domain-containing protein [Patescibacteria group bacterium]|nr:cold shock domain-containing protein [Patescibacteria group bacterium]
MNGTIKKLIADKGFGFIKVDGQEKDLFFHSKSLSGANFADLHEGDMVSFDVDDSGPKGPAAINVQKA